MVNTGVKPPRFKISRIKLQNLLKLCWSSKAESWLQWVTCWNNFVRIATHSESRLWSMAKSTRESELRPSGLLSTTVLLREKRHAKREFRALQ